MSLLPASRVEPFKVRYCETGRDGRLKMRPFFNCAEEIASCHAEELGIGISYLVKHRLAWMLSKVRFAFPGTLPKYGETITLETYPLGVERLFAVREFVYLDASGKRWAAGSSEWIVVDLEKMRPLAPAKAFPELWPCNPERERFFPKLEKFPLPEDCAELFRIKVPESGIDLNGHLNNAEYASLVQDVIARWGRSFGDLAELQINFLRGALTGDEVICFGNMDETGFVCGGKLPTGEAVFEAEGIWKK